MHLWAFAADGSRRELEVEGLWPHKSYLVLKFRGIDSISNAEPVVGCELQVPEEERAKLDPGWTYVSDLAGCTVFDGEREIGQVYDVQFGAGEAPLLIVKNGAREHMVPFAQEYVKALDTAGKRIVMQLPEGLLELDAPLNDEEKKRQHRDF